MIRPCSRWRLVSFLIFNLFLIGLLMSAANRSNPVQIRGIDLERWRTGVGLTTVEAAAAFGMNIAKWKSVTHGEGASASLDDPTVALLLQLYRHAPESAPIREQPSVPDFYAFLGFENKQKDYEHFGALVGRSAASVIRLLHHNGTPGRVLGCWIEALTRLGLTPRQTLQLMEDTARAITGNSQVQRRTKMKSLVAQDHHG